MRNYLARFHFISKLLLLVIPPIMIIFYLTAVKLTTIYTNNKNLREVEKVITLSTHIGSLVHELQIERGMSAGYLGSNGEKFVNKLSNQRKLVDIQFKSLQTILQNFKYSSDSQKIYGITSGFQEIKDVRTAIDAFNISVQSELDIYTHVITLYLKEISLFARYSNDGWLTRTLLVYVSFLHVEESMGIERAIGANTFGNKKFLPGMHNKMMMTLAQKKLSLNFFLSHGNKESIDYYTKIIESRPFEKVTQMEDLLIRGKDSDIFDINPEYWFSLISQKINTMGQVDKYLTASMVAHIKNHESEMNKDMIRIFALNILMVLLMLAVVAYVSKTLYEEIRDQQKVLLQQSKMSAMGEMIGAIAHQWRQPLNAIGVLTQEIEFKYEANLLEKDELKTLNKEMLSHLDYMSNTINDFRDFFKPDKEKIVFNIHKAIEDSLKIIGKQLEVHDISVNIETRCEDEDKNGLDHLYEVNGYESEFKQVIINLINNAREAIESNLKNSPSAKKEISVIIDRKASELAIYIRDTGGGIKKEILNSIFDIYISSKHEQQGTGLGLYMSKLIIERNMLGKISAKNIQGGAEFEILLFTSS